jgi:hypothetical protein
MSKNSEVRKARRKQTGEDFTPAALVNEILDKLPTEIWKDSTKTWLDPAAGNGNFLVEVKWRLMEVGHDEIHIFENMIFGVDLMPDNCEEMIERLYGGGAGDIIEKFKYTEGKETKVPAAYRTDGLKYCFKLNGVWVPNIVCADGLVYDYSFGRKDDGTEEDRPDPMDLFGE